MMASQGSQQVFPFETTNNLHGGDYMLANGYQEAAMEFAVYPPGSLYPFFGLAEESGEVMGKVAKAIRKGVPFPVEDIEKELGDVLWMVAACCDHLNTDMGTVMQKNLAKLADRASRDCIVGEGDTR